MAKASRTGPDRIDPNSMQTELGRKLAGRINRDNAETEIKVHRLVEVLKEYLFFESDCQMKLASGAIAVTLATLAYHKDREKCERWFDSVVDRAYVWTDDAEQSLSEIERHTIDIAASAVGEDLVSGVHEVLNDSLEYLAGIENGSISRILADSLYQVLQWIEHIPEDVLQVLVPHCLSFCIEMEKRKLGIGSDEEFARSIDAVFEAGRSAQQAVLNAIEKGELSVVDGQVVKTQRHESVDEELDDDTSDEV